MKIITIKNRIRNYLKIYIKPLNGGITGLLLIALFYSLLYNACSDTFTTWNKLYWNAWGIIYNISISYVTAFIFYYVVVFRKEQNDKAKLNEIIIDRLTNLLHTGFLIVKPAEDILKIKLECKATTYDYFAEYLYKSGIRVNNESNTFIKKCLKENPQKAKIITNAKKYKIGFDIHMNSVFLLQKHLDVNIIDLILKMQDNPFFTIVKHGGNNIIEESFIKSLKDFIIKLDKLDTYLANTFPYYTKIIILEEIKNEKQNTNKH